MADLSEANLAQADLTGANLTATDLFEAILSECRCSNTVFANLALFEAKGLDSINHGGPSTIGIDTLLRSMGEIPVVFLRGCGVHDELITYLPSLLDAMQRMQFYSCFISYSSKDQAFADRLRSRLVQEKLRVWYAPEDMRGGQKQFEQIHQAIRVHDKFLLVLSDDSIDSPWIETELRTALQREKKENVQILFPIRLASIEKIRAWRCFDGDLTTDMAVEVRKYHIPNFSNWKDHVAFEEAFAGLLNEMKRAIVPNAASRAAAREEDERDPTF